METSPLPMIAANFDLAWHSWPGSSPLHTYCDTEHLLGPVTHTHTHTHTHTPVAERLAVELSLILILERGVGIIHFTGITNILPLISLIEC